MRVRQVAVAAMGAVLAIGSMAGSVAAQSDPPGYGDHQGDVGAHWILDNPGPDPEYPAATCLYGGSNLRLKLITARQPVMIANTAGGFGRQQVGWKAVVERSSDGNPPWTPVASSGWTRKTAVAPYPVDLAPKEITIPSPPDPGIYRVTWRMRWYRSNGSVDGSAAHFASWYRVSSSLGPFNAEGGCPHTLQAQTAGGASVRPAAEPPFNGELGHTGTRGPHWILDTPGMLPEYPAVTCTYAPSGALQSVAVRRPMILARDTGAGLQAQDVAWRAVLQGDPTLGDDPAWSQVLARTPWTRAGTTELSWAKVQPRAFSIGTLTGTELVRVVYEIRWFKGRTTQVVGTAKHTPLTYGATQGSDRFSYSGRCYRIAD